MTAAAAAAMQAPCPEPRHFVALVTGYAWRAPTMYLAVLPLREYACNVCPFREICQPDYKQIQLTKHYHQTFFNQFQILIVPLVAVLSLRYTQIQTDKQCQAYFSTIGGIG